MPVTSSKRVIVGMSGGVDSSVSALLLQRQGYQVEGLFMKNWEEDDTDDYCPVKEDLAMVEQVCQQLDIPLHTINFAAEYWEDVFEHFLAECRIGRTPNPDILCNKLIKFKAFLDYALWLGADFIATGHYVRRHFDQYWHLLAGVDSNKDQSYFLYTLNQYQIAHSLFPIGELTKPEVRQIAKEAGLPNYARPDSTGICFIGERSFRTFLSRYLPAQPGKIEDTQGNVLGEHQGLMYYTIGQRRGLGIGGQPNAEEKAWYVAKKDLARNVLVVVQGTDHPWLFSTHATCSQIHWISGHPPTESFTCQAKIRYRQAAQPCKVIPAGKEWHVEFLHPQRAVTPGQSIVFYHDDDCLGGGIIDSAFSY